MFGLQSNNAALDVGRAQQGWKAGKVKTGDNQGPQVVWGFPKGQRTVRGVYANSGHQLCTSPPLNLHPLRVYKHGALEC